MRILIDIVHPAHVHFYRHMVDRLRSRGHELRILSRVKDVTAPLLDAFGLEHRVVGGIARGRLGQARELLTRDRAIWQEARRFGAELILTRNPAGVQAARLAGVRGVFDTDDGRAAGLHFKLAAPFAHVITTPDCFEESYGAKHWRYPAYKQAAYLHPDLFQADPKIFEELGLAPGTPYSLVRLVAMRASHDSGESGLSESAKREILRRLAELGPVFVSSESGEAPPGARLLPVGPERIHHVLASATLVVGDSQTVAAEAAVLGVPNLRVSSFSGRLPYLNELEQHYRLTRSFRPENERELLEALPTAERCESIRAEYHQARRQLWRDKVNLVDWYVERIERRFEGSARDE